MGLFQPVTSLQKYGLVVGCVGIPNGKSFGGGYGPKPEVLAGALLGPRVLNVSHHDFFLPSGPVVPHT